MKDHTRGAFEGLALGLVAGAATSFLVAYFTIQKEEGDRLKWLGLDEEFVSRVVVLGPIGAVIGAFIGGQRGSKQIYYMRPYDFSR
jgi:hypothetical protein